MPLSKGYTRTAIAKNIAELVRSGEAQDVAIAIAYEKAAQEYRAKNPGKPLPDYLRGEAI